MLLASLLLLLLQLLAVISQQEECAPPPEQQIELVLLLDASWSQSEVTWAKQVTAAQAFVDGLLTSASVEHRLSTVYFHRDAVDVTLRARDAATARRDIGELELDEIRARNTAGNPFYATDHPDALARAEEILSSTESAARRKVVVMLTDGEPWKASARCRKDGVPGADVVVELPCEENESPCFEDDCSIDCLCAVHEAEQFRKRGHELFIVGVPNDLDGHDGNFDGIMTAMASDGRYAAAESFDALSAAVEGQLEEVCAGSCSVCRVSHDAVEREYAEHVASQEMA